MTYRKKLIEVAMPLDAINNASAHEKAVRRGHPSALHLWWARRPLAACRAILFASLVDDPSNDLPENEANKERERLFRILEDLVRWENINNETVIGMAREEIIRSTRDNPPSLIDPFCGGGAIPLEAQRLGLEAYASDLNPVAVLITKALIEIPAKFVGKPPVNPDSKKGTGSTAGWRGASGLAADVRFYGQWMHNEAWKRIGHLYPKGPNGETVITWLWTRTVKCPNPACGTQMPLVRSFWLSTQKGKRAWVKPILDLDNKTVRFETSISDSDAPQGTVNRLGARCILCGTAVSFDYIRAEGKAGCINRRLMAMVGENQHGRIYLSPDNNHESIAVSADPDWIPDTELPEQALGFRVQLYGISRHAELFTSRQLVFLSVLCDLVEEAHLQVIEHSGRDEEYANAVTTYLGLTASKIVDSCNAFCRWRSDHATATNLFARPTLSMLWDFAEVNPFQFVNYADLASKSAAVLETLSLGKLHSVPAGAVSQLDATQALPVSIPALIATDPPYYDNIGYADLSDFFYIWLRRMLKSIYPELFSTLLTPKNQELIASPYRFDGSKQKAKEHFENGLEKNFVLMRTKAASEYPVTLYYAFKQAENDNGSDANSKSEVPTLAQASTGWETMLQGLLSAGFQITATWPMRTELGTRMRGISSNALASSVVLAFRLKQKDAPIATRREFLAALRKDLPQELRVLMNGRVAPVDLAQASIGPGMAIFSRYSKVLEANGSAMTVRTALQEINYFLEDYLAQQEGDLDVESQFCVVWFQQYGSREGPFGEADVLSRAKDVSVDGLARLGLVDAERGKVHLTLRESYEDDWDPRNQSRITAWEACQRLVWSLNENGEQETGRLARRLGGVAEQARQLAYRLYGIADRKGWAEEASGYNALVSSWSEIQKAAAAAAEEAQGRMM